MILTSTAQMTLSCNVIGIIARNEAHELVDCFAKNYTHPSNLRKTMEEETKPAHPVIDEYKGKPVLRIPLVDEPNPETPWHWMSFGKNKAKGIVKWFEEIKRFSEE